MIKPKEGTIREITPQAGSVRQFTPSSVGTSSRTTTRFNIGPVGITQSEGKSQQDLYEQSLNIKQKEKALKEDKAVMDAKQRAIKLGELGKTIDSFAYQLKEIPAGKGAIGRLTGLASNISAAAQTDPKVAGYYAFSKGMRPQLARGLGDVGNLSEVEQKAAEHLLPLPSDNEETRVQKFKNFLDFLSIRGIPVEQMDLPHIKTYIKERSGEQYLSPTQQKTPAMGVHPVIKKLMDKGASKQEIEIVKKQLGVK